MATPLGAGVLQGFGTDVQPVFFFFVIPGGAFFWRDVWRYKIITVL